MPDGIAVTKGDTMKPYMFGNLPMGAAFLAHPKSQVVWRKVNTTHGLCGKLNRHHDVIDFGANEEVYLLDTPVWDDDKIARYCEEVPKKEWQ